MALDDQEQEGHLMDIDEEEEIDIAAMDVDAADSTLAAPWIAKHNAEGRGRPNHSTLASP